MSRISLGDKINQNIHSPTEGYLLKSKSAAAFYQRLLQHVEISKKNKKKLFSRWEIVFPHISSNQWHRKRKSFYQLFFFLAPSMEVPRLAAISYKRHLMNRLKHGEGIPSSAPTLQGIYRSIHYSDIVGSEEVSNRIKGHAVTTNQSWTTRINILSKNLGRYTRGHKYLSWGVWYVPQCSGP